MDWLENSKDFDTRGMVCLGECSTLSFVGCRTCVDPFVTYYLCYRAVVSSGEVSRW